MVGFVLVLLTEGGLDTCIGIGTYSGIVSCFVWDMCWDWVEIDAKRVVLGLGLLTFACSKRTCKLGRELDKLEKSVLGRLFIDVGESLWGGVDSPDITLLNKKVNTQSNVL